MSKTQKTVQKNDDSNLDDSNQVDINDRYQMAIFKKRIMWQATIFALKIVFPVVFLAIILMQFIK